ncbi:MAG: hypothetical protein HY517_00245 [Candidatus Aenigmarchaeota archaeon]|nr:hypothetical protein [Candidatus Aenigmarchaeota archaeon]
MEEKKKPTYTVGISTGFWRIGKDPNLLGLAQKIGGLGATGGIRFVQIDLESVAEFAEPDVKQQISRIRSKLGMDEVGLHGEIGELMALDSAEKRIWDQTHRRLCQTVRFAAEVGFLYVNIHFSNKQFISFTEAQHRTQGYFYPVVDPFGRGLQELVKNNPQINDEARKHVARTLGRSRTYVQMSNEVEERMRKDEPRLVEQEYQARLQLYPGITEDGKRQLRERVEIDIHNAITQKINAEIRTEEFEFRVWLNLKDEEAEKYQLEDGEWGAYHLVAHWMKAVRDTFWTSIAGNADPEALYLRDEKAFCAAVASKYIEGHLTLKDNPNNKSYLGGMSIKEWCEKHKLMLLLENPESGEGAEGLYRLFDPRQFYVTIKKLNSPFIMITIDFEHMVSQGLDPNEILDELPGDFGKMIFLFHLGQAVPYGGVAHIPIARGSNAQEQIYKWLFILRKKGWKTGYMMFERGGGRTGQGRLPNEVFEDSVQALRQIAAFLEKDIHYDKLPPEFFGISIQNEPVWARQLVAMREHAWDPLEGLLSIPEEKHTFLSKSAVDKGKGQEWEKRKFR